MATAVLTADQIAAALDSVAENVGRATEEHEKAMYGDHFADYAVDWYLELAFAQLVILAEALNLEHLRARIETDLEGAKKTGLQEFVSDPDEEVHLKWALVARRHVRAVQGIFGVAPSRTVTKDVESILRATTYSITDPRVFDGPPQNETDVHLRIEAVLKCIFTDLKHKPAINKAIKNFQPDTGLPSIRTLIEYKFLSSARSVAEIADELLADTRGYTTPEWTSFVYVIYETQRFRSEAQWRQLMRESGVGASTTVVVITGELPAHSGHDHLPQQPRTPAT